VNEPRFASFLPGRLVALDRRPTESNCAQTGPASVVIRNATFTYPGGADPAFRGLNLNIPAGSFVAVTGPIGSGKSALARCLASLYPLDAGEILIDATPASQVPPGLVGYAPQEGHLFSGSIRDNIFLGQDLSGTDALDSLLRLAALEEDVGAMAFGPDTQIGELGIRVSGGQRQRLGLARSVAARPRSTPGLLVLDDPFSAVDIDTETRIVANLRCAFGPQAPREKRSTVVLFSQRLGAFPQADLVLVLDGGRIVERGTHGSLLDEGGLYARIYRAQLRVDSLVAVEAQRR
jgi:ABC-type multidrug transport system fused ATPase/permease subunit